MEIAGPVAGRDFIGELPIGEVDLDSEVSDADRFMLRNQKGIFVLSDQVGIPQILIWHEPVIHALRLDQWNDSPTIAIQHGKFERLPIDSQSLPVPLSEYRHGEHDTYLEWREYCGVNSGFFGRFMRFGKEKTGRLARVSAYGGGFAIAKVVRVWRRSRPEIAVGPKLFRLLKKQGQARRPDFAQLDLSVVGAVKALGSVRPAHNDCVVILVHGTLSSSG